VHVLFEIQGEAEGTIERRIYDTVYFDQMSELVLWWPLCDAHVVSLHVMYELCVNNLNYSTVTEVFLNLTEVFLTLAEVFPCFFLSCKANARVQLAKTGHVPYSMLFGCYFCCSM
jgi:hypothetical protein